MEELTRRKEDDLYFQRLTKSEVWQHNVIWVSFVILVLTGFMSLIPTDVVEIWFGAQKEFVFTMRLYIHLIVGVILILGSLWHLFYLIFTKAGRSIVIGMIPNMADWQQMKQNIAYMLGLASEKPAFDRFDYREKMEYIFGGIGTTVIILTGIVVTFSEFFSKFVVDISLTVHLMEATLASITISIWHFYAVHFKPGKFPQSTIWLDGLMPMHELEEEHLLQYERVIKERETGM